MLRVSINYSQSFWTFFYGIFGHQSVVYSPKQGLGQNELNNFFQMYDSITPFLFLIKPINYLLLLPITSYLCIQR